MRAAQLLLAGFLVGAAFARPASAYTCIAGSCTGYAVRPVPFKLNAPSQDLGPDTSEAEVKRSMEAWTKPSCTNLQVQYGGRTDEAPANGNAVIAWVESGWTAGNAVIGQTTGRLSGKGLTSHMKLNGVDFKWVTGATKRGEVNAFSIVAHESGHFLGLGHSSAPKAIMQASYSGGELTLTDDDIQGICKIYPGNGGGVAPPTDCRQQGCAAGLRCVDGVCKSDGAVDAGVVADAGAPGGSRRDAGSAQRLDGGKLEAGTPQESTMPPPPLVVADAGAPASPPSSAAGPSRADGQSCESNDECRSRICLETAGQGLCSHLCDGDAGCGRGFVCQKVGSEGVCTPATGATGGGGAAGGAAGAPGTAMPAVEAAKPIGGGCTFAGGGGSPLGFAAAAGALGLLLRRRRR